MKHLGNQDGLCGQRVAVGGLEEVAGGDFKSRIGLELRVKRTDIIHENKGT